VFDFRFWRQLGLCAVLGALSMAAMLAGLALLRDTAGHDWYAAWKVTAAQAVIASGFDREAPMEYRTSEGETETLTRYRMTFRGEALVARSRIVGTAARHAILGLPAGAVLAAFFVIFFGYGRPGEIRPARPGQPPREAWGPVASVEGMLMLDGMAPAAVVVVPPADGEPAKVYGSVQGRAALPNAQDKEDGDESRAKAAPALPAPPPASRDAQPGQTGVGDAPNQPAETGKPKPATRRKRNYKRWI